jgi:hypothetical protein
VFHIVERFFVRHGSTPPRGTATKSPGAFAGKMLVNSIHYCAIKLGWIGSKNRDAARILYANIAAIIQGVLVSTAGRAVQVFRAFEMVPKRAVADLCVLDCVGHLFHAYPVNAHKR